MNLSPWKALLLIGLLAAAAGLALLAYALWPLPGAEAVVTLPATLFAPSP